MNAEITTKLRAPFSVEAIKVKPQTVTQDKTKGLVTFYVDSRLVVERLNDVVGAENWEDSYRVIVPEPALGIPVECSLTISGVTKVDVGQVSPGDLDAKVWKSAYSDAFKRAAVKFGVAAYLYEAPNVWAEVKVGSNGKVQGFSDAGTRQALDAYRRWIGAPQGASEPAAATARTNTGDGTRGVITEAQQKRLYAIATAGQVETEVVKRLIKEIAGVDSSREIPKGKYDAVVAAVEAESVPF